MRDLELQCKERVELLEALRDSLKDANSVNGSPKPNRDDEATVNARQDSFGFIGGGTIPAVDYPDIVKPTALPRRPLPQTRNSSSGLRPTMEPVPSQALNQRSLGPSPTPMSLPKSSRTPSPEKRSKMRTTLRADRDGKKNSKGKQSSSGPPAASKAAGLAWDTKDTPKLSVQGSRAAALNSGVFLPHSAQHETRSDSAGSSRPSQEFPRTGEPPAPPPHAYGSVVSASYAEPLPSLTHTSPSIPSSAYISRSPEISRPQSSSSAPSANSSTSRLPPRNLSYRNEFSHIQPVSQASIAVSVNPPKAPGTKTIPSPSTLEPNLSSAPITKAKVPPPVPTRSRPVPKISPRKPLPPGGAKTRMVSSDSDDDARGAPRRVVGKPPKKSDDSNSDSTPNTSGRDSPEGDIHSSNWEERLKYVKKNLPRGIDPWACRQIFNEIVVKGDEVHWSDVAGLDQAKGALKEAVVYPFLRPELFVGLREPARGMLLFGPPGTGKTMLARAVATESKSTFFAISASSLTSKWLGESEKLVKALFALARALAPSIIFVDEIDSLLSSRGGSSEHESTRRIKTEFLIEWSALQRAAAGKEQSEKEKKEGDATRVLVLAATNLPWAIDEAARRRFVRRQYIPLPEPHVREEQIRTLLSHQKHNLSDRDIRVLVNVTDGMILSLGSLAG